MISGRSKTRISHYRRAIQLMEVVENHLHSAQPLRTARFCGAPLLSMPRKLKLWLSPFRSIGHVHEYQTKNEPNEGHGDKQIAQEWVFATHPICVGENNAFLAPKLKDGKICSKKHNYDVLISVQDRRLNKLTVIDLESITSLRQA